MPETGVDSAGVPNPRPRDSARRVPRVNAEHHASHHRPHFRGSLTGATSILGSDVPNPAGPDADHLGDATDADLLMEQLQDPDLLDGTHPAETPDASRDDPRCGHAGLFAVHRRHNESS
jgi:hypothetical protein